MNTSELGLSDTPGLRNGEISFTRLEMLADEYSPLALVWYRLRGDSSEKAARIDLHKQAFLDEIGTFSRDLLDEDAKVIVQFVQGSRGNSVPVLECRTLTAS